MNIIEIKTDLSIDDAVQKLSRDVAPSIFKIKRESLIGKVSSKKVLLYRGVPFQGNSFLPVFVGSFQNTNNETVLRGKWTIPFRTKLFWIIIIGFFVYNIGSDIIISSSISGISIFSFVATILFGIFTYLLGQKISIDDRGWIIQYVKHIFNP